jgi:hypothetical protein
MDFATVEADIAADATAVEHAVAWLLGMATLAERDIRTLEATSPLVKDAIIAGEAAATAHGVPVARIVTGTEAVLALAQQVGAVPTSPGSGPAAHASS